MEVFICRTDAVGYWNKQFWLCVCLFMCACMLAPENRWVGVGTSGPPQIITH